MFDRVRSYRARHGVHWSGILSLNFPSLAAIVRLILVTMVTSLLLSLPTPTQSLRISARTASMR